MFGFMVTADGGLTTAGYVITVIAGIILQGRIQTRKSLPQDNWYSVP